MTPYERVYACISSCGIPGALQAYPEGGAPPAPFFIYSMGEDEFYADGTVWARLYEARVELYESAPDFELERRVGEAIEAEFGPYSQMEDWIESEHARMVTYEFCAGLG